MKITVIRIKKLSSGGLRAFADVSFDGVLVKGCKVFTGPTGLFAGLPSQKGRDEKYYDTVVISDEVLKAEFVKAVLDAYAAAGDNLGPSVAEQEAGATPGVGNAGVPF